MIFLKIKIWDLGVFQKSEIFRQKIHPNQKLARSQILKNLPKTRSKHVKNMKTCQNWPIFGQNCPKNQKWLLLIKKPGHFWPKWSKMAVFWSCQKCLFWHKNVKKTKKTTKRAYTGEIGSFKDPISPNYQFWPGSHLNRPNFRRRRQLGLKEVPSPERFENFKFSESPNSSTPRENPKDFLWNFRKSWFYRYRDRVKKNLCHLFDFLNFRQIRQKWAIFEKSKKILRNL